KLGQCRIVLQSSARSVEGFGFRLVDAVFIAVGDRRASYNFATNVRGFNFNVLNGSARVLQDLLEFAILESQTSRFTADEPIETQAEDKDQPKPGPVAQPTPAPVFPFFLLHLYSLRDARVVMSAIGNAPGPLRDNSLYA